MPHPNKAKIYTNTTISVFHLKSLLQCKWGNIFWYLTQPVLSFHLTAYQNVIILLKQSISLLRDILDRFQNKILCFPFQAMNYWTSVWTSVWNYVNVPLSKLRKMICRMNNDSFWETTYNHNVSKNSIFLTFSKEMSIRWIYETVF